MNVEFHLIVAQSFDRFGRVCGKPSVRAAKNKPALGNNEVAIAVSLSVPDSLFKRPNLQASIVVPESQAPVVITPEIQENIAEAIAEQFGIRLHISAPEGSEA